MKGSAWSGSREQEGGVVTSRTFLFLVSRCLKSPGEYCILLPNVRITFKIAYY